jgi:hypothetical protein
MIRLTLVTPQQQKSTFQLREFGEQVAVLDERGSRLTTGRVVGRVRGREPQYDVLTEDCGRLCGLSERRLVSLERV